MLAGFASLQTAENRLLPGLIADAGASWLLEMAPATSPSPALGVPRHRMLLGSEGWIYPCRAPVDELPFADESLPGLLLRHLIQPGIDAEALTMESLRCLKAGGLLISVSANPWHPAAWRELGGRSLRLPAWPRLLMMYARHGLELSIPRRQQWSGLVPGITPVLVVVARKAPRPAKVEPLRLRRGVIRSTGVTVTQCRAA